MALPHPVLHGLVDAQDNFDALQRLTPTEVTTLPAQPFDGQIVYFVADATNGVVWNLRYNASSSSAYKWESVGGSALGDAGLPDTASASLAGSTWGGIDANDPQITVPLAGDYDADTSTSVSCDATATLAMGIKVGATEPIVGTNATYAYLALATGSLNLVQRRRLNAVPASTVLQQRYWHNGAVANVGRRASSLFLTPIRVG